MNDKEYSDWIASETAKWLLYATAIYAVALGAYWMFIA